MLVLNFAVDVNFTISAHSEVIFLLLAYHWRFNHQAPRLHWFQNILIYWALNCSFHNDKRVLIGFWFTAEHWFDSRNQSYSCFEPFQPRQFGDNTIHFLIQRTLSEQTKLLLGVNYTHQMFPLHCNQLSIKLYQSISIDSHLMFLAPSLMVEVVVIQYVSRGALKRQFHLNLYQLTSQLVHHSFSLSQMTLLRSRCLGFSEMVYAPTLIVVIQFVMETFSSNVFITNLIFEYLHCLAESQFLQHLRHEYHYHIDWKHFYLTPALPSSETISL